MRLSHVVALLLGLLAAVLVARSLSEPSDGEPLTSRSALTIDLRNASGEPWSGSPPVVETTSLRRAGRPGAWPDAPRVLLYPYAPGADVPELVGIDGGVVARHRVVFESVEAERVALAVIGAGLVASRTLDLAEISRPVEVAASESIELGTIEARVLFEGVELEPPGSATSGAFELLLEHAATRAVLATVRTRERGEPFRLEAPAGTYRLVAQGRAVLGAGGAELLQGRVLGRAAREVAVAAGGVASVELALERGARLEILLRGEPAESGAQVRWILRSPGLRDECLLFRKEPGPFDLLLTASLTDVLPIGRRGTSEPVPPGSWRLIGRLPGGRSTGADVTLVEGETTVVELALEP